MQTTRDRFLRLKARKENLIRQECLKRSAYLAKAIHCLLLKALLRDGGLVGYQRAQVKAGAQVMPRLSSVTTHKTRCRVTGRARQVTRATQLSRMHVRLAMREGALAHATLGRD